MSGIPDRMGGRRHATLGGVERERILVVEDDERLAHVLGSALARGYEVCTARSGGDALAHLARGRFDLVVLDLNLPDMDGLEVAERVDPGSCSILMLTARADVRSRVAGLYAGANDYLAKPFVMDELLARVHVQLRARMKHHEYRVGRLVLSPTARTCSIDGADLALTALEFRLLELLIVERGRIFSRQALEDRLYVSEPPGSNALEVLVSRLRAKLAAAGAHGVVETVRGLGYVVRDER